MVTVLNVRRLFSGVKAAVVDLSSLVDPRKIEVFFANMRLQAPMTTPLVLWGLLSMFACMVVPQFISDDFRVLNVVLFILLVVMLWLGNYITDFLLVSGYFTYLGYFISGALGKTDYLTAVNIGLLYFLVGVFLVLTVSYIIVRFGGGGIKLDEAFPLAAYPTIPALISGIFAVHSITFILNYVVVAYSVYLFYVAVRIRLGFDRAIKVFLLSVFLGGGLAMIVFKVFTILLGIPEWAW